MSFVKGKFLAYGFLLGTAGVKILGSKEAKKVYTDVTATVLRGADCVMKRAEIIKENCQDIAADAKEINKKKAEEERLQVIEDAKAIVAKASKKSK